MAANELLVWIGWNNSTLTGKTPYCGHPAPSTAVWQDLPVATQQQHLLLLPGQVHLEDPQLHLDTDSCQVLPCGSPAAAPSLCLLAAGKSQPWIPRSICSYYWLDYPTKWFSCNCYNLLARLPCGPPATPSVFSPCSSPWTGVKARICWSPTQNLTYWPRWSEMLAFLSLIL